MYTQAQTNKQTNETHYYVYISLFFLNIVETWFIVVIRLGLGVIKLSNTNCVLVLQNHPIRESYPINTVF